jgi:NAD(P)-dependent dehydrogenase (short-subunit alcohol dehydrogenase family)
VFDQIMAVNVKGVFLGLRHVLPVMIAAGRGAVVNTASIAGLVGSPGMAVYSASKHAVNGFTKSVAGEVGPHGIRVNSVCPGPIATRMIEEVSRQVSPNNPKSVEERYAAGIPLRRYGTAEEVANLVLFLLSDLASNMTGGEYTVDGGRTAAPAGVSGSTTQ